MDIHRCRFIPYPASPINALAFSHTAKPSKKTPQSLRLALGRANGDIEIWNPAKGKWSQESTIRGGKNRSVEGLAWTQDLDEEIENTTISGQLRLFSIGYSNAITEWNLATGMPLRHSSGSHAEIWSLAVQPRWRKDDGLTSKSEQLLAVGCADGSIVLHSTADGELTYLRTLRRSSNQKARVLSLTFCDRNTIAAGCSDGTIWVYDIRGKSKVKSTMHLGSGPSKASIYVWTVKYLSDDVLVSGDSTGELKFWDLKTFTLTQRLLCHDADVLTLASDVEGNMFFSGGMDRKVCMIAKDKTTRRWREIFHQKMHSGQVKAMASIETKDLSVVVSGGVDAAPVLIPLRSSGQEYTRSLPGLPQTPPLISAPKDRLLVSWWDREVAFCELNKELSQWMSMQKSTSSSGEAESLQRILVQGEENISSVSISRDGRLLAIATNASCKIFVLSRRKDGSSRRIRRLESDVLATQGARHISFSPDGQWLLLVQPDNQLNLFELQSNETSKVGYELIARTITLDRADKSTTASDPLRAYQRTICRTAWSEDSKIVVVADIGGHLDVWTLLTPEVQVNGVSKSSSHAPNGHVNGTSNPSESSDESEDDQLEDSSPADRPIWRLTKHKLPKLPSSPLLLSFRPDQTTTPSIDNADDGFESGDRLVVITLHHELLEFHTRTGRLTDWSKRNPSSQLPIKFSQIKDRVMGCVWDTLNGRQRLWLYGSTFVFMFDMNKDVVVVVVNRQGDSNEKNRGLKRKRSGKNYKKTKHSKGTSGAGDTTAYPNDFGLNNASEATTAVSVERDLTEDDDDEDVSDWEGVPIKSKPVEVTNSLDQTKQQNTEDGLVDGDSDEEVDGQDVNEVEAGNAKPTPRELPWWSTHKYRPILGLVALEPDNEITSEDGLDQSVARELEVALVERPLWDQDLDLPFLS